MELSFTTDLDENIAMMKRLFVHDDTFICREVRGQSALRAALFFFDGMVNSQAINESIVKPISLWTGNSLPMPDVIREVLQIDDCPFDLKTDQLLAAFLYGDTIVLVDGDSRPAVVNTKGFAKRGPDEPDNEKVLRGPREGFTEAFMGNLALIRRRLRTPNLCFEFSGIGSVTHTTVSLCYIQGIADEAVLETVRQRLQDIPLDSILDANYLGEIIRDNRFSPFPTVGVTERPDIVAAKLLEGRVAIVVDGTLAVFEILKEAGTRTPDTIGQALSIVGGLVLGQAAVDARFVSAPMVIIIAFSGVTALIVPKLRTATLLLRFFLLVCAALLGLYGVLFGGCLILAHLCRLSSFGVPYLTNVLAAEKHSRRDVLLRFPWFAMKPEHRFLAGWRGVRR